MTSSIPEKEGDSGAQNVSTHVSPAYPTPPRYGGSRLTARPGFGVVRVGMTYEWNLAGNHVHGGEVVDRLVRLVHAHDTLRGD